MQRIARVLVAVCAATLIASGAGPSGAAVPLGATLDTASETPTPALFTASLDSTQETDSPTVGSPAPTGTARFALNADNTLTYAFSTQNLTGPALAAHLHEGGVGVAGPIRVTLDVSGAGTTAALTADQVTALRAGNLYINVHTLANQNGEIRGQITALPVPSGSATFTFDPDTNTLTYAITTQHLSGAVTASHLHTGQPGVAGGVAVTLSTTLSGSVTTLTTQQINDLYDGNLYVNVHTALNPNGEIRGQVAITGASACHCTQGTRRTFLRCIAAQIRALDKSERRVAAVKAIKKAAKLSSCGRTKGPRKAVACCLQQTPAQGILLGRVCAPIPAKACTKNKGTSLGTPSTCFPTNPCMPAASPSGAFVDGPDGEVF